MTTKIFEERVISYCKEYGALDFQFTKSLLEPCHKALQWRDEKYKQKVTQETFRKNIEFTRDSLLELHNFISDDGNKKLVKRCTELLKYLDKYEDGKMLMHSKMYNYFNLIFFKDIPTKQNIVNLAKRDTGNKVLMLHQKPKTC